MEKGLRKGQLTYVATLIEIKPKKMVEVPNKIVAILQEYENVMPLKLTKKFPTRRPTNHRIKLVPGAKHPTQVPYRMTRPEMLELRKQLTKLLDTRLIQPSRALYGVPMLFLITPIEVCFWQFLFQSYLFPEKIVL